MGTLKCRKRLESDPNEQIRFLRKRGILKHFSSNNKSVLSWTEMEVDASYNLITKSLPDSLCYRFSDNRSALNQMKTFPFGGTTS